MWGALVGAGMQAGGSLISARGERKGADAMIAEQQRQNLEQQMLDEEQAAAVDAYTANLAANPLGARMAARSANTLGRASAAMPIGARRMAGAAAGVDPARVDQRTARILPGMATGAAAGAEGDVMADVNLGLGQVRGKVDDVNFKRRNKSRFYKDRLEGAARKGQGSRQAGEMLQLGGQAMMGMNLGARKPAAPAPGYDEEEELDPFASTPSNLGARPSKRR